MDKKILEGKSFCRVIKSDGLFGQPKMEFHHTVSFTNDRMNDDANTFFGNPPQCAMSYEIRPSDKTNEFIIYRQESDDEQLSESAYSIILKNASADKFDFYYNGVLMQ
jgi:hypothetical protein